MDSLTIALLNSQLVSFLMEASDEHDYERAELMRDVIDTIAEAVEAIEEKYNNVP